MLGITKTQPATDARLDTLRAALTATDEPHVQVTLPQIAMFTGAPLSVIAYDGTRTTGAAAFAVAERLDADLVVDPYDGQSANTYLHYLDSLPRA